jgi:hypothetical protein
MWLYHGSLRSSNVSRDGTILMAIIMMYIYIYIMVVQNSNSNRFSYKVEAICLSLLQSVMCHDMRLSCMLPPSGYNLIIIEIMNESK